ncbi:hypothetical protein KK120_13305 [Virgibacillus dakarensis]|nr:hypothetical protein [Virgibacillus dakarensis]
MTKFEISRCQDAHFYFVNSGGYRFTGTRMAAVINIFTINFLLYGEKFLDIYQAESINEANKLYQNWLSNVPKELISYFEDLIKSIFSLCYAYSYLRGFV